MTKPMARADLYMLMETTMKVNGSETWPTGMAVMNILTAKSILESGIAIKNTDMELNIGQTTPGMKAASEILKSMEKVSLTGKMGQNTKENSILILFKAEVPIPGLMAGSMRVNGSRIKCMAKEHLRGQMADNT